MSKAPAFQFYPADWLTDVELQSASATSRGIWINALCLMWESRTRGELTGTPDSLSRLLNCSRSEFDLFCQEASVTKFADVTFCNGNVTLKNRRMVRDEKIRNQTRLRVKRCRDNATSNAEVTPPSSSSSSSSSKTRKKKEEDSLRSSSCPELVETDHSGPSIPLVDGTNFYISQDQITAWQSAYPALDIPQEIRKAWAWCDANPKNRKTRAGAKRFLVAWLSRAQDKAPRQTATGGANPAGPAPHTYREHQDAERRLQAVKLRQLMEDDNGRAAAQATQQAGGTGTPGNQPAALPPGPLLGARD